MGDHKTKDALFDGFAEVAKALGNGRRAELVDVLEQGERHVEQLAVEIDQSVANTSFHLRVLAAVGLVTTRRDGNRIYYRLTSDRVGELWAALRDVAAAHHDQIDALTDAYLGNRDGLERIGRDDLAQRLAAGDVILIDVRPVAEYEAGHIAGAALDPDRHLRGSAERSARRHRGGRLLPRTVLCLCRPSRPPTHPTRPPGPPPRGRLPPVATRRPARGRHWLTIT